MKKIIACIFPYLLMCACMENHQDMIQKASVTVSNSFEPEQDWKNTSLNIPDGNSANGNYVSAITPDHEFGPCFERNTEDLLPLPIQRVHVECMVFCKSEPEGIKLVLSVDGAGKNIFWLDRWLEKCGAVKNKWCLIKADWMIDKSFSGSDRLKMYFWNSKRGDFLVDNFKITFYPG